jgi:hypothetical protein
MFLLALAQLALAGAPDFAEEAKSRMKLSFDNDAVQAELAAPAPAALPNQGVSRGAGSDRGRGGQTDPVIVRAPLAEPSSTSRAASTRSVVPRSSPRDWRGAGRPN